MKRFLALILSLMMIIACLPVNALADAPTQEDVNAGLHFLVRHWHAVDELTGLKLGDTVARSAAAVTVEGYIAPAASGYTIKVRLGDGAWYDVIGGALPDTIAPYVTSVNATSGEIKLNSNVYLHADPLTGQKRSTEEFAGYSLSAGHQAAELSGSTLTITYRKDVHLTKAHAFYFANADLRKNGTDLSEYGDRQKDTRTESGKEKEYDTSAGLHTDKTASMNDGIIYDKDGNLLEISPDDLGRTFDIDLEAWYSLGEAPQVAMVLDASGSMAFTVGTPERITLDTANLTPDQRKQLEGKKLPAGTTATSDWEQAFLTDKEIGWLLNAHNTDNSSLSSAGYTYYVYDKTGALEYAPLGYWNGDVSAPDFDAPELIGEYHFTNSKRGMNDVTGERDVMQVLRAPATGAFTFRPVELVTDSSSPDRIIYFENGTSENRTVVDAGFNVTRSGGGLLLGAKPTGNKFTVMLQVTKIGSADNEANNSNVSKETDLLYFGPLTNLTPAGVNYYRLVRQADSSKNRLSGYLYTESNVSKPPRLTSINNVFSNTKSSPFYNQYDVIATFDGSTMKVYARKNGDSAWLSGDNNDSPVALDTGDINIILSGFDGIDITDNNTGTVGSSTIYIDNVYVLDDAYATPADVLAAIADVPTIDLSEQFPAMSSGEANAATLGTITRGYLKVQDGTLVGTKGWYFINPIKDWDANYDHPDVRTGKTLHGTPSQRSADYQTVYTNVVAVPDGADTSGDDPTSTYDPAMGVNTPVKFYIDSAGNLRCFFASAVDAKDADENAKWGCSYVYESDDLNYIKTEALQRALGIFLTQLYERSPGSQVAAVRFSTRDGSISESETARQKLLLLNWTDEIQRILGLMNLKYGNGDTQTRSAYDEYNYGLTGNTSTWAGLQAFYEFVQNNASSTADDASRYLIVFTDGKDTDIGGEYGGKAMEIATRLREDFKYIIFGVMLDGGPVEPGNQDYKDAWEFLEQITDQANSEKQLVFATTTTKNEDLSEAEKINRLVDLFANDILNDIVTDLSGYNVQDYIDPRFDIVDGDGVTWYLGKGGNVTWSDGVTRPKKAGEDYWLITLSNSPEIETDAKQAQLHYKKDADMYFVRWVDQTIPNSPAAVKRDGKEIKSALNVWNGRITIRAKEDFIGGNAVLTNGNDAMQNYVYHPDDPDANSGTDRSGGNKDDLTPSKGFPRTTVNVHAPATVANGEALIYLGEAVNNQEILEAVVADAIRIAEENGLMTKWYWEYITRYEGWAQDNTDVIAWLLDNLGKEISLPYYYLPNAEDSNTTGGALHKGDRIGTITYKLETVMGDDPNTVADNGADHGETLSTLTRRARITVTFTPDAEPTREAANNSKNDGLIIDPYYAWDKDYKPAQGTSGSFNGHYDAATFIVSGEVVLELLIPQAALTHLQSTMPGQTIAYQAALNRTRPDGRVERVGTMKVSYTVPAKGTPVTGDATAYATLTVDSAYDYAATYGLPVGTYSLEPLTEGTTQSSLFAFSSLSAVTLEDTMAALFKRYGTQHQETGVDAKALTALAATGGLTPKLGTDSALTHTDERYALIRVTILVDAGTLTVSKAITGEAAEANRAFHFTVMLSDTSLTGTFGGMTFNKGVASFTLKGGESLTAEGLPTGTRYSVIEQEANQDGYVTTVTGATGTIGAEAATAVFINAKDPEEVPATGDNSHLGLWLTLMCVSMAGVILARRRRS